VPAALIALAAAPTLMRAIAAYKCYILCYILCFTACYTCATADNQRQRQERQG
jgi:hypothetical protein